MKQHNIIVTSYTNPDLDGTACAIAYAEFLQKTHRDAVAAVSGKPHREAQFVFKAFSIQPPQQAEEILTKEVTIIICDASDLNGISSDINPLQVIEVIDHRRVNEAEKFAKAKIQIELVGSCATLIAEKFYQNNISISKNSAALLYSAIVSNTINFQNNVTTDRDKKMAKWLQQTVNIPTNYIHDMFAYKSRLEKPLKDACIDDFAYFTFANKKIGIIQLEILKAGEFITLHQKEIKQILQTIKQKRSLDYIFFTCIAIENNSNIFIVADKLTKKLLEETISAVFINNIAKRNGILMRKEITPIIKRFLEENRL